MRVLIIHPEARSFAGAERVLEYFLQGMIDTGLEITVAVAADTKCASTIPKQFGKILVPDNGKLSLIRLCQELATLRRHHRSGAGFSLVHGWAARDWELSGLLGRAIGQPAIGTLHDHPLARFISRARQNLMRGCARYGLRRTVCVSQAVSDECVAAGYPAKKLTVIHNGLPSSGNPPEQMHNPVYRLGFLGVFSERKGLRDLFFALDELARINSVPWQAVIAGAAGDAAGESLIADIRQRFSQRRWWSQVQWHGWVDKPNEFLRTLDLLIVPSSEFDPLPTVLLEAGGVGLPVLAARIGGVEEIVIPNQTGWLFESGNWRQAADLLSRLLAEPHQLRLAGPAAFRRISAEFTVGKMVDNYRRVYSTLVSNV